MLTEVMILSFGGQGGVTAARILALAAVSEGMYAQAIPQFGAERRGSLVRSYLRLSDRPIRRHSSIKKADVLAIFAEKILGIVNANEFIRDGGIAILNAKQGIAEKNYCVNAADIALSLNLVAAGWPIVNTAMAGAMAKPLGLSIDSVIEAIKSTFPGELAEVNAKAAEIAYREVRQC
ncbi:2-oxoacid:acceptor oxidoreductase family protein [Archaeoglobus veneficus]|uniref:pyruvate synthase n=1 Tax=Archaeoglobus veneficus (strain DSM 11195 / SNP6) TaxID=693661 RepID=F2KPL7_ARCVS|nr:2-oxoacid:acceptor oxidoreductase family protein [Archaeoglobus veneficus]AEA47545.1 pyruvate/ketoisovalerate oxidoreductase, gamma subunit [Archaeoglobus veneficus SNP6]